MQHIAVFWATAVGLVWIIIAISTVFTKDYTGLTIVTPLMFLTTGVVLGIKPNFKKLDAEEDKK